MESEVNVILGDDDVSHVKVDGKHASLCSRGPLWDR